LNKRQEAHARLVTVRDALVRYEASVVDSTAKLASRRKRMRVLRRAMEAFLTRPVSGLSRGDLIGRLDEIQSQSGGVSRNRAQSEARHFLGWCRDRELVPSIVIDRVRQSVREQPRDRVLSDQELAAILAATSDRSAYSDLVRTLLLTAMRRNEAASLQPRDLDFDGRTITVRPENSKTRVGRVIPMADGLFDMLRQRSRGLPKDGYLFGEGSDFKKPFSGFSKRFARLAATMPAETEPFTLHDIRRTVATDMHSMGVDALVVDDLLGHLSNVRSGVRGIYNRAQTLSRQRESVAAWSARIAAIMLRVISLTPEPAR
jgi:integrase